MKIGIAGPMTLDLLRPNLPESTALPHGYPFPMTALLVGEILRRGHEVVAYTTSIDIAAPLYISKPPFTLCIMPSRKRHRAKTLFHTEISGLLRAMQKYPCDILNAQWTYEFAAAALASSIPALVTLQDHARTIFSQYRDWYRLVRWGLNTYVVNRAEHLSVTSPHVYSLLTSGQRRKTVIVPNFLNETVFSAAGGNPARGRYMVSVSNGFSRLKNIQNALLAFHQCQASLGGLRYFLIGQDCQAGGPAHEFCKIHNCLKGVVFVGPVPYSKVMELVGNALFMVHPSYEESFGMSVLESMALGTPVIGGRSSGNIPILLRHLDTGYLCDVGQPDTIRDAVCALAGDARLREAIGVSARRHALDRYSASVVVDRYIAEFQNILGAPAVFGQVSCQ